MTGQRRQVQRRNPQQGNAAATAVEDDNTVPAADVETENGGDTATPAARSVPMRISSDVLRQLLRLRPEVNIVGATWTTDGIIELDIVSPSAPPDAIELLVTYRHTGTQDPIHAVSTWSTEQVAS